MISREAESVAKGVFRGRIAGSHHECDLLVAVVAGWRIGIFLPVVFLPHP